MIINKLTCVLFIILFHTLKKTNELKKVGGRGGGRISLEIKIKGSFEKNRRDLLLRAEENALILGLKVQKKQKERNRCPSDMTKENVKK